MLSRFGKRLCTPAKCFPGLGNDFAPLQNAFPIWEMTLHPCKILSRFGKRLCTLAKCFPGLGNDFAPLQNAFPVWEMILHLLILF